MKLPSLLRPKFKVAFIAGLGGLVTVRVVTLASTSGGGENPVACELGFMRPGITADGSIGVLPDGSQPFPCTAVWPSPAREPRTNLYNCKCST